MKLEHSELGKKSNYVDQYSPDLLFPIARAPKRLEIGVPTPLPFHGYDLWNAYEISWLNPKGKPIVAMAEIIVPATSSHLIESKSLKLYFNSFNNTTFENIEQVQQAIITDLSKATESIVELNLLPVDYPHSMPFVQFGGVCLDDLDLTIDTYLVDPDLLSCDNENSLVNETCYSHLLKSNCLVTGQPDWGSIEITYSGQKINHHSLLKYLISFRNHNEFHEQCVERIFMDISTRCQPRELTVYARYTRRGGLDINPYRSTNGYFTATNPRLIRQ